MISFIFERSYNGTDWEKVPNAMYAFNSEGLLLPNTLFIDRDHIPYYLRVVVNETPIEREVP